MRRLIARHPRLSFAAALALVALAFSPVPQVVAQNFARIYVLDGTAGSPSMTFNNNTNRGVYNDTANSGVAVAVGGAQVGRFQSSGLLVTGKLRTRAFSSPTVAPSVVSQALAIVGTDQAAKITTTGAVSSIWVGFTSAWGSPPVCLAQNETRTGLTYRFETTAGGGTISGSSAATTGDVISFSCMGNS